MCKDCAKAKSAAYRNAQADRVQAYAHDYNRRPEVMEQSRDFNRRRHVADRDAAFDHYGRECTRCGSTDDLQINRVDGSGQERRRADPEARTIYRWLRKHGYPQGFQTLCRSCNLATRRAASRGLRSIVSVSRGRFQGAKRSAPGL